MYFELCVTENYKEIVKRESEKEDVIQCNLFMGATWDRGDQGQVCEIGFKFSTVATKRLYISLFWSVGLSVGWSFCLWTV